jgi:3-oxoacyl-[acyl-carrier protein] reductase
MAEMSHALNPFGRGGTPEEAAGGVFLLCTPWANYINGQLLTISGGQLGGMSG